MILTFSFCSDPFDDYAQLLFMIIAAFLFSLFLVIVLDLCLKYPLVVFKNRCIILLVLGSENMLSPRATS